MYFPDERPDYYLQGLLGYTSANQHNLLSIAGGIGYELRDQVTLEGMLGYNRYSYTYTTYGGSFFGGFTTGTATTAINIMTVAVTFNVYFY